MTKSVLTLPVTIEQIATAIKRMSPAERQRLFELVPELQSEQSARKRTDSDARASLADIDTELSQILGQQPLLPDEPFIGNLTLGQYLDLPDDERERLWDELSDHDAWIDDSQEKDVRPDALPA